MNSIYKNIYLNEYHLQGQHCCKQGYFYHYQVSLTSVYERNWNLLSEKKKIRIFYSCITTHYFLKHCTMGDHSLFAASISSSQKYFDSITKIFLYSYYTGSPSLIEISQVALRALFFNQNLCSKAFLLPKLHTFLFQYVKHVSFSEIDPHKLPIFIGSKTRYFSIVCFWFQLLQPYIC